MKIAVDIDDTLNIVDRVGRAGEYIRRKNLPFRLVNENTNKFVETYDWQLGDVLEFIREGGITAFTDAEARKWARETLEGWRAEGHEVVILTSREEEWFVNPEKVARDWLEKRRIPYDEIVARVPFAEKGKYCAEHGIPPASGHRSWACARCSPWAGTTSPAPARSATAARIGSRSTWRYGTSSPSSTAERVPLLGKKKIQLSHHSSIPCPRKDGHTGPK